MDGFHKNVHFQTTQLPLKYEEQWNIPWFPLGREKWHDTGSCHLQQLYEQLALKEHQRELRTVLADLAATPWTSGRTG